MLLMSAQGWQRQENSYRLVAAQPSLNEFWFSVTDQTLNKEQGSLATQPSLNESWFSVKSPV